MPATTKGKSKNKKPKDAKPKIPYHRKPDDMSLDVWQSELRRQYAETRFFLVENIGNQLVFSDFKVQNPESGNTYKVAIRSAEAGQNFCSCMDFKTNSLGTCKHIEYVLYNIKSKPRLLKILEKGYEPHYSSVYLSYIGERKVVLRIGTEEKSALKEAAKNYFTSKGELRKNAYGSIENFLTVAHSIHPEFRIYDDAMDFILQRRADNKRESIVDKALENETEFFGSIIKATLFPYQKEGVIFALRQGRILLADDMGLGKTIQAIAAAEGMKKLFGISKVLIVCPTSLKYQWKSEIEKFAESEVTVIEGNLGAREKQYESESFYKICSYNVVGRDIHAINKNEFDLLILDEAQRIKNWQTKTAANVKKIDTTHAIVLTGTPLENKIEELYSVVQMVDPFRLGSLYQFLHDHRIVEENGKTIGYKELHKIKEVLNGLMIRRHKKDVLHQLPERMDKNLFVPMQPRQREYYDEFYDNVCRLVLKWRRQKFLNEKDRQRLLIDLSRMRMVCDSTYIIDQDHKKREDSKIEELMGIMDEVLESGNEKVVIFSQWERMTRLVALELDAREVKYENLNGNIPAKDREVLFKNFNQDPASRVFLSTDAGGVGLNLQVASIVINLDLPWNPAVLEQRIARVYRMGQKNKVQVINFITSDSIEADMLAKLKFKSSMSTGILDDGENAVFLGDSKFEELMKTVEEMTVEEHSPAPPETEPEKSPDLFSFASPDEKNESLPGNFNFMQDEPAEDETPPHLTPKAPAIANNDTNELIQIGAGFLGKLMETLSDKEKTTSLVNSLVKKDKETGQTVLQIPIQNADILETGLKLLGQLLGR